MPSKPPRKWARKLIAWVVVLVGTYLFACYWLSKAYVSPPRVVSLTPPGAKVERISEETPAWTVQPKGKVLGVATIVHGYGGTRASMLPLSSIFTQAGYMVVIPAMPGQDESKRPQVGFSVDEAKVIEDCVHWVAKRHPGLPQVLFGYSMGGAAVWSAAPGLPEVKGVISEGAFGRFGPTVDDFFGRKFGAISFLSFPIRVITQQMSGKDPSKINPIEQAKAWRGRKGLVIHGAEDVVVRPAQGEALAEATGTELWMIPNCAHVRGLEVAPAEYEKRIRQFLSEIH